MTRSSARTPLWRSTVPRALPLLLLLGLVASCQAGHLRHLPLYDGPELPFRDVAVIAVGSAEDPDNMVLEIDGRPLPKAPYLNAQGEPCDYLGVLPGPHRFKVHTPPDSKRAVFFILDELSLEHGGRAMLVQQAQVRLGGMQPQVHEYQLRGNRAYGFFGVGGSPDEGFTRTLWSVNPFEVSDAPLALEPSLEPRVDSPLWIVVTKGDEVWELRVFPEVIPAWADREISLDSFDTSGVLAEDVPTAADSSRIAACPILVLGGDERDRKEGARQKIRVAALGGDEAARKQAGRRTIFEAGDQWIRITGKGYVGSADWSSYVYHWERLDSAGQYPAALSLEAFGDGPVQYCRERTVVHEIGGLDLGEFAKDAFDLDDEEELTVDLIVFHGT